MRMDTREGQPPRQSCLDLAHPSLSHPLHLQPPIDAEPPPRRSPRTTPASHSPPHLTNLSPSHRCPPERARWRPKLHRQASSLCRARALPGTPPTSPNQQQPTTPTVEPSRARALPLPVHALHAESDMRVLKRARPRQPRNPRNGARHRTCVAAPRLPCTLADRDALAAPESDRSGTEPAPIPTKPSRHQRSRCNG
jgi:hypothetical protein